MLYFKIISQATTGTSHRLVKITLMTEDNDDDALHCKVLQKKTTKPISITTVLPCFLGLCCAHFQFHLIRNGIIITITSPSSNH